MNCTSCSTPNRPGAQRCKRCGEALASSCPGCGEPLTSGRELCTNCRTERVPAALGAEIEALDDVELFDDPLPDLGFPLAPRFVGRDDVLDRLGALLDEVVRSRELKFVLLSADAGMGKTRVAQELRHRYAQRNPASGLVRTSNGSHAGQSAVGGSIDGGAHPGSPPKVQFLYAMCGGPGTVPYAAFRALFRELFGIAEGERADVARAQLYRAVETLLGSTRAFEVAHLLAPLIGHPFPDSPVVEPLSETPAQLESRTFIAVKRYLHALAERAPLCLTFDDIDRASPETVNLIHYLAAGLASSPVVLLTVGRLSVFEAHPTFGEGDVTLERVNLSPLSPPESEALLTELVVKAHGTIPPLLIEHAREMDGTPRALFELVRYLLETGVLSQKGGGKSGTFDFNAAALDQLLLPADLETILSERLEVMEAYERDLLEKAAACGEAFWLDAVVALVRAVALDRGDPDGPTLGEVAAAGDRTRSEVESAFRQLERRGLLVEQAHASIPGEREYRFAYPPWWDVVYARIDTEKKRRYHRLVAQWLELRPEGRHQETLEQIGHHLERAGDGQGAAVHYRRAADAARNQFYNDRAIRLYDAALACLGPADLASRIHLWHDLGSVFQLKGEFDQALAAFERMLRLAWVVASRTKAAVAFNKMGRIYRAKGELPIALEYLQRGLELFEQSDDVRGVAGSHDDIGQVFWLRSRYTEALDHSARALELRRKIGDRRSIASSLTAVGHIERHRGLFAAAEACYREAITIREALGDRMGLIQCHNGLGMLAFQRGDVQGARTIWESAFADAEKLGALPLQAGLLNHLGEAARALGQRGEAKSRFEAAEALAHELDDRRILAEALLNLGLLDLQTGATQRALEQCQRALELAQAAGIRVDVGRALVALGEIRAATLFGDTEGAQRAEEYFRRGVELFREIGNDAELAAALERFGKYRVETGEVSHGKQLLQEAQGIFSRLGMRAEHDLYRVLGEL